MLNTKGAIRTKCHDLSGVESITQHASFNSGLTVWRLGFDRRLRLERRTATVCVLSDDLEQVLAAFQQVRRRVCVAMRTDAIQTRPH